MLLVVYIPRLNPALFISPSVRDRISDESSVGAIPSCIYPTRENCMNEELELLMGASATRGDRN